MTMKIAVEKKPTFFETLESNIKAAHEGQVTMDEAEKLAAKFLDGMMRVTVALKAADLDARMRKQGLKAVKAAVYLAEVQKADKKPSDTMLGAIVDQSELVASEQLAFDKAEVERDALQNYFNIFREAHVYFRGIAKGKFE